REAPGGSVKVEVVSGDLMFAANMVAQKIHVARVTRNAFDDDVGELSKFLSKETRARRIAEIKPERRQLWSATALCGVRGEQSTYGNVTRYYWSLRQNPSMETVCKGCMTAWRKIGEPEIKGWDRTISAEEAWPWELPFGWRELEPTGHPWDVADKNKLELVKDKRGEVVGEHRVE